MNRITQLMLTALLPAMTAPAVMAQGKWMTREHDFGAFDENVGTVYCDFYLVNEGTEPMAILSARANCGCTKPEYSTDPVAPGDTAVIRVGYDPEGRPGKFSKQIKVDCGTTPLRSTLTIRGTVIGASNTLRTRFPVSVGESGVKLRSTNIPYGKVYNGETSGQYIEGYNATADSIHPYVTGNPKYLNVMIQPATVGPGEQFIISTVLHAPRSEWGTLTDEFIFHPDTDSPDSRPIQTVAIISEDFSRLTAAQLAEAPVIDVEPVAIDLERISKTDKPLKRTFTIANRGKSPLVIRRISCADPAVSVKAKDMKIKPGKSTKAEVVVTPALIEKPELLNARINIIANDPEHPSTMVRVVAELM